MTFSEMNWLDRILFLKRIKAESGIEKTVTGNPIHITDALAARIKSLLVTMEPIQDLHGQANPYPAGGGKNLLPAQIDTVKSINRGGTWSGNVYTRNGVTFTLSTTEDGYVTAVNVNGTATSNAYIKLDQSNDQAVWLLPNTAYIINGTPSGTENTKCRLQINYNQITGAISQPGNGVSFTTPASITEQECYVIVLSGKTANNLVFKPMIRLASVSDATFAPYSNICPISGRQSVTVTRTGKNLLNPDTIEIGSYTSAGAATETGNPVYRRFAISLPAGTYTFSTTLTNAYLTRYLIDDVQNYIQYVGQSYTITLSNAAELKLTFRNTSSTAITEDFTCQIELGSTATAYEPYQPIQTVTVQLGQTVYGGTVDVVTGTMVVDRAMVTYDGSENWYAGAVFGEVKYRNALDSLPNGIKTVTDNSEVPDVVTNLFPAISADSSWHGINGISMQTTYGWRIYCDAFNTSDIALWKAYLAEHPLTVAYKLVTPLTIQLTPEQLTTLLGTNNVWSDGNDITMTYKARKDT